MDMSFLEVAKNYGFSGLTAVFSGLMIYKILNHFMIALTNKDEQIKELAFKFADALENHSSSIRETNEMTSSIAAKNSQEHNEILKAVGRR